MRRGITNAQRERITSQQVEVSGLGIVGILRLTALNLKRTMKDVASTFTLGKPVGKCSVVLDGNSEQTLDRLAELHSLNCEFINCTVLYDYDANCLGELDICTSASDGWPYRVYQHRHGFTLKYDTSRSVKFAFSKWVQCDGYRWRFVSSRSELQFTVADQQFSVPAHLAFSLRIKCQSVKQLTSGDIIRWLKEVGFHCPLNLNIVAPIVANWLGGERRPMLVSYLFPTQRRGEAAVSEGKDAAHLVQDNPLGLVAYAPVVNEAASLAAVKHRLCDVRNLADPGPVYSGYAKEFVDILMAGAQPLVPLEEADVLELQDRPIQKQRNLSAVTQTGPYKNVHVTAFVKKEAYTACKAPRNISNVMVKHNVELSRFSYAFKKMVLNHQHWYMPCRSMQGIAECVQQFVRDNGYPVVETDFSKFDGTISVWLRTYVELAAYERVSPAMAELVRLELNAHCVTTEDYEYDCAGSRLSGSPVTTDGNTLIAAFVDYCAGRETGLGPVLSYRNIGLHFGDDGLSAPYPCFERVAAELGLSLKCETRDSYVGFLGRIYPDPLHDLGSFQDPVRSWSRITTLSGSASVSSPSRLKSKLLSYLRSDAQTPWLGDWIRKWLSEHEDLEVVDLEQDRSFISYGHEWPELKSIDLSRQLIQQMLDMTASELDAAVAGQPFWHEPVLEKGAEFVDSLSGGTAVVIHPSDFKEPSITSSGSKRSLRRKKQRDKRLNQHSV